MTTRKGTNMVKRSKLMIVLDDQEKQRKKFEKAKARADATAKKIDAKWSEKSNLSEAQLKKEIAQLLNDNEYNTITPWRIRKVLTDIVDFAKER